jgi:phosphohistidine phosphatase
MPKQLLIMRHAKSSWSDINSTDHERPLNRRGLKAAPQMGRFVAQQSCVPDLVFCSTAIRAQQTAELFIENCAGIELDQLYLVDEFYHASPRTYLEQLASIDNVQSSNGQTNARSIETAMVIGHNPGLEELVLRLSGNYETMPTAAIAFFRLNIECWSAILNSKGAELIDVWRPKVIF